MPETARLQIQGQDADPVRVVGLTGGLVRIGRGPSCDVRLNEADIADEECRLRRRGDAWQLVPARSATTLRFDGRIVAAPRSIAYGVPFQVGGLSLTLHPAAASAAAWSHSPPSADPSPSAAAPGTGSELADDHRGDWQAPPVPHDRWLQTHRETKRWESQFRAAGEKLRAAEARPAPAPDATPRPSPTPSATLRASGLARPSAVAVREPLTRRAEFRPRPAATTIPPLPKLATRPEAHRSLPIPLATAAPAPPPTPPLVAPIEAAAPSPRSPAVLNVEVLDEPEESHSSPIEPEFFDDDEEDLAAEALAGHRLLGTTTRISWDDPRSIRQPLATIEVMETAPEVETGDRWVVEAAEEPPIESELLTPAEAFESREEGPSAWGARTTPTDWTYQAPFVTDTTLGEPFEASPGRFASKPKWSPRGRRAGDDELRAASNVGVDRSPVGRPAVESNSPRGDAREWPTVSDILAARGGQAPAPRTAVPAKSAARPVPTVSHEPEQWRLPLWLGWVPASAAALSIGMIGLAGAWTWSRDGYNAGVVARRLAAHEKTPKPLPDGVAPGGGRWWETTAPHLIQWAAYLDKLADDPAKTEAARERLFLAAQASPLNATVRHAVARGLPGETPSPVQTLALGLGQSRDVLTLTAMGRRLLEAGHKRSALETYRAALAMASVLDPVRTDPPIFLDETPQRRYSVPTEEPLVAVVRDMAASDAWTYEEWSSALPRGTAAALAAARALRDQSSPAADLALEAAVVQAAADAALSAPRADALAQSANQNEPIASAPDESIRLAASGAVLAMKQRWAEARDCYRHAIDRMPVEAVRRAWWVNVADLSLRLNEDADRRLALDAAKNADPKDEITRRAVDLQKTSGFIAQRTARRDANLRQVARP